MPAAQRHAHRVRHLELDRDKLHLVRFVACMALCPSLRSLQLRLGLQVYTEGLSVLLELVGGMRDLERLEFHVTQLSAEALSRVILPPRLKELVIAGGVPSDSTSLVSAMDCLTDLKRLTFQIGGDSGNFSERVSEAPHVVSVVKQAAFYQREVQKADVLFRHPCFRPESLVLHMGNGEDGIPPSVASVKGLNLLHILACRTSVLASPLPPAEFLRSTDVRADLEPDQLPAAERTLERYSRVRVWDIFFARGEGSAADKAERAMWGLEKRE
ncbi:hypothetical protein DFJ74DRAFT_665370 [Hyaloraphidium curvatum]|nr:hypothetical protein DFJ74DRAFT_665370 [Hyaloraphidium curvatum]